MWNNMYAYHKIINFATLSYVICWPFLICFEIKKLPRSWKRLSMVLQDNSFQTLVLILKQDGALFLQNKPRNELSDFFCTLKCGDKNSFIEITTTSRFTCVFINCAKILAKRKLVT